MITRALATAAAALLLTATATATAAEAATPGADARTATGITGKWKGGVYGDNGGSAGYPAKVTITKRDGKLHGHVVYPDYCSGKWVYQGKKDGWFRFREVITKDPGAQTCVTPVNVKTHRVGAKLRVVWTEPRTGDSGYMNAHRL